MLISFEGIDFCGKSTQVQLLKTYLEQKGYKVATLREPGGTDISERIREILLDKKTLDMDMRTEILLFSASRAQLINQVISPLISSGTVIILDRFFDSTTAYQGFGRGIPIEHINNINNFAVGGNIPDLTFILDISVEAAEERKNSKSIIPDRMESSGLEFFERVRVGYINLATTHPRFKLIDGSLPVSSIHSLILTETERLLTN